MGMQVRQGMPEPHTRAQGVHKPHRRRWFISRLFIGFLSLFASVPFVSGEEANSSSVIQETTLGVRVPHPGRLFLFDGNNRILAEDESDAPIVYHEPSPSHEGTARFCILRFEPRDGLPGTQRILRVPVRGALFVELRRDAGGGSGWQMRTLEPEDFEAAYHRAFEPQPSSSTEPSDADLFAAVMALVESSGQTPSREGGSEPSPTAAVPPSRDVSAPPSEKSPPTSPVVTDGAAMSDTSGIAPQSREPIPAQSADSPVPPSRPTTSIATPADTLVGSLTGTPPPSVPPVSVRGDLNTLLQHPDYERALRILEDCHQTLARIEQSTAAATIRDRWMPHQQTLQTRLLPSVREAARMWVGLPVQTETVLERTRVMHIALARIEIGLTDMALAIPSQDVELFERGRTSYVRGWQEVGNFRKTLQSLEEDIRVGREPASVQRKVLPLKDAGQSYADTEAFSESMRLFSETMERIAAIEGLDLSPQKTISKTWKPHERELRATLNPNSEAALAQLMSIRPEHPLLLQMHQELYWMQAHVESALRDWMRALDANDGILFDHGVEKILRLNTILASLQQIQAEIQEEIDSSQ